MLLAALPAGASTLVRDSLAAIQRAAGVAGLVSLGLLLFNGSNFFVTLESVFDLAYHVPERHPVTQRVVSVVALFVLTGLVLLATAAGAVGGVFGQAVANAIPWLGAVVDAGLATAVSVAGLVASFVLLYWGLPNTRVSLRQALPGALVSSALFLAVLRIFPLYVALFGQGFSVYAAFGTRAAVHVLAVHRRRRAGRRGGAQRLPARSRAVGRRVGARRARRHRPAGRATRGH